MNMNIVENMFICVVMSVEFSYQ